jgi:type IV secretory pathway VirB9-like protein
MRKTVGLLLLLGLSLGGLGCAAKEEPLPPVPPMAEDLSTWSVPELVQPPKAPWGAQRDAARPATKEEQVVEYLPGTSTKIAVGTDGPVDLVFELGEDVRNIVGGGASPVPTGQGAPAEGQSATHPQWDVREAKHGSGESLQAHLLLRANAPGLTMGLVITTTRRTYLLTCKSVKSASVRVVRWTYPQDSPEPPPPGDSGLLPDPAHPKLYHIGYDVKGSRANINFFPRHVIDDGKKLFLVYPEVSLFETVPVVRMIGPNGPQLINVRQYLNVVIVDQLAPRLELRVGIGESAEVVTITRGTLRTIACPGEPDCPVWPAAAQTLARRVRP